LIFSSPLRFRHAFRLAEAAFAFSLPPRQYFRHFRRFQSFLAFVRFDYCFRIFDGFRLIALSLFSASLSSDDIELRLRFISLSELTPLVSLRASQLAAAISACFLLSDAPAYDF